MGSLAIVRCPYETTHDSILDRKLAAIGIEEVEQSDNESHSDDASIDNRRTLSELHETRLITSPYSDYENQTDLTDLETPSRLLAFALTRLQAIRPDYATASYLKSFNWAECFEELRRLSTAADYQWTRQEFYVVIFRSRLQQDADRIRLGDLDKESHREACESGGLLKYWFGECDGEMRNLATCLWRSREDAIAGGKGPWHAKAMRAAKVMYEEITFERHILTISDGAESWELNPFVA